MSGARCDRDGPRLTAHCPLPAPARSPRGDSNPLTYRLQVGCAAVAPLGRLLLLPVSLRCETDGAPHSVAGPGVTLSACRTHYSARKTRALTHFSVEIARAEVNTIAYGQAISGVGQNSMQSRQRLFT